MINKVVDLVNELQDIAECNWMHVVVDSHGRKQVFFAITEMFFNNFQQFDIIEMETPYHKFQTSAEVEGITFKALLTQQDYEKYVLKLKTAN